MLADAKHFLQAFLRSPTRVGAVAPSSPALAARMVEGLVVAHGETVVEFGPGTGPFTDAIARVLPDPACYVGIERDPGFHRLLAARFPQLRLVEGSAEDAPQHLREAGREKVKAVICGLPFASLPPSVQDAVIAALDEMIKPGAEFRTFQYLHSFPLPTAVRFRRRMDALFGPHKRSRAVWRNLPPAFVFTWTR